MNFRPISTDQTPSPTDGESPHGLCLGRLVSELGNPPPDVAERWVSAARTMLSDQFGDGRPLPSARLDGLELMSTGEMRPIADVEVAPQSSGEAGLGASDGGDPIEPSRVWMNEFCSQLGIDADSAARETLIAPEISATPKISSTPEASTKTGISTTDDTPSTHEIARRGGKRRLGVAVVVVAIAGLLATVWLVRRTVSGPVAQTDVANPRGAETPQIQPPAGAAADSSFLSDDPIGSDGIPLQSQADDLAEPTWAITPPETEISPSLDEDFGLDQELAAGLLAEPVGLPEMSFADSGSEPVNSPRNGAGEIPDDPAATDAPAGLTNPLLTGAFESPDSISEDRPTIAGLAPPPTSDATQTSGSGQSSDANPSMGATNAPTATLAEVLEGDADDDPSDTADDDSDDQPTRKMSVAGDELPTAVSLAAEDLEENDHRLWTSVVINSLAVESPSDEVSFSILGDHPQWQILGRDDQAVATIDARQDGAYFRWADDRGRTRDAMALRRSRLRLGDRLVYLRLPVGAEPFRFRFDDRDQNPAWNLDAPIAMGASEMTLDWELPESVDVAWIEPIESDTFRGGRAIATLSPSEDETYAVGIRMDFRCGRKLTCRLRYAARLDPTMPWQPISHSRLDQAAIELTQYADAVEREKQRLARVDDIAYELAGRQGKRIIAEKTARNDDRAQWVRTSLQRVNQLQGMLRDIENGSELRIRLRTRWHDGVQPILNVGPEE